MQIFLNAFGSIPDPRASNARHDLGELLVIAFVSVLCGSSSCAEMAEFGRAKENVFRSFLKLKHAIPSQASTMPRNLITPDRSSRHSPKKTMTPSKSGRTRHHATLSRLLYRFAVS